MRWLIAGLGVLLGGAAWGEDLRESEKARSQRLAEEAIAYAKQLDFVAGSIQTNYVRPVLRSELIAAARRTARNGSTHPLPGSWDVDLKKACAEEAVGRIMTGMLASSFAVPGCWRQTPATHENRLPDLVRQTREAGDIEELRGPNALLVSLRASPRLWTHIVASSVPKRCLRSTSMMPMTFMESASLRTTTRGPLVVKSVVPGGPARRQGCGPATASFGSTVNPCKATPRDRLVEAQAGASGAGSDVPVSPDALPNQPGPLALTFERAGSAGLHNLRLDPEFYRGETVLGLQRHDDNNWNYWLDRVNHVAHVRIAALSHTTTTELSEVLAQLKKQEIRGLILDLRWCPGGFLLESVSAAQLFVGSRKVATVKYRIGPVEEYARPMGDTYTDFPIVVLVNGESSGGAELIAAALQDHHRAIIAGQRTLGKGSVQRQMEDIRLPNDLYFKLTTGVIVRPNGKNLNRFPASKLSDDWGVRPDPGMEFRISADVGRQLRDWYLSRRCGRASRGKSSCWTTANDPQRQMALAVLLQRIERTVALARRAGDGQNARSLWHARRSASSSSARGPPEHVIPIVDLILTEQALVGYHGLSSRSSSQQSGEDAPTQTGFEAPAR